MKLKFYSIFVSFTFIASLIPVTYHYCNPHANLSTFCLFYLQDAVVPTEVTRFSQFIPDGNRSLHTCCPARWEGGTRALNKFHRKIQYWILKTKNFSK